MKIRLKLDSTSEFVYMSITVQVNRANNLKAITVYQISTTDTNRGTRRYGNFIRHDK